MVVYCTTNLINGKKYIGKDSNNNPKYLGSGRMLMEDFKIYGRKNFKKEIIEYCKNDEELIIKEIYWIRYYKAVESDDYYNLIYASGGGFNYDKLTEEKHNFIRKQMSDAANRRSFPRSVRDEASRKRSSEALIGQPKPEGFGQKISQTKQANPYIFPPEICDKISKGKTGSKYLNRKCKKIIQYNLDGSFVKEWDGLRYILKEHPEYNENTLGGNLSHQKKVPSAYRFIWEYKPSDTLH